jgi:hypothetical protein
MTKDPFADLRNHIQELMDAAALRERELVDANAALLHELNAVRAELRTGVDGVLRKRYEDREAAVSEKLAGLLGNANLACYGVDDLIERLRDELSAIDWMGSAKRMAGG